MKKIFNRISSSIVSIAAIAAIATTGLVSCNPEPDESDLFTATDETAADFIARKSELSSFNYILTRVGMNRTLAAYGEYTCFVPNNSAVDAYIEKLWNDNEAIIPHNGLTEPTLEGLTDSLCNDIAKYHLASGVQNTIDIGGGGTSVTTLLGQPITTSTDSLGYVRINSSAAIIEADSIVSNGIVHVIDSVIPRNTRLVVNELERHSEYSIFVEALKLTGLADSLTANKKMNGTEVKKYTITDRKDTDTNKSDLWWPEECEIKYTIFAEPNSVLEANGIHNLEELIEYANNVYGGAAGWYDMLKDINSKGLWSEKDQDYSREVSTGTDYTSRNNALNMFVAYHILYCGMPVDELVYEDNTKWRKNQTWNYVNGCRPFDYYETMLPNTILKIWNTAGTQLLINRYRTWNTLTDEPGNETTEAGALVNDYGFHQVVRPGIRIARTTDTDISQVANDHSKIHTNIATFNGYIHAIRGMLVYDELVPKGVLHERLRFDATTFMPEFINNGIRMSTSAEMSVKNGGGSGARVAFPLDFFDGVVSYTSENRFRYNVKGAYNAWQGDTFQGWGNYDLAIKLPPIPSGNYEFRIFYTPMGHGGMMQFYMGNSSKLSSMVALDIPLDVRIAITDPRIGWTNFNEEEDYGIATDAVLRNHGYMRGLYSYRDHVERDGQYGSTWESHNQRYAQSGNNSLRKIMGRFDMKQSQEYWFRIKSVLPDESDLKWQFDYIEFMPVEMVDNPEYTEDWF